MKAVFRSSGRLTRAVAEKNLLVEAHEQYWSESEKVHEHQLEDPPLRLTYQTKKVSEASVLKKVSHVVLERVDAYWSAGEAGAERQDTMIRLLFKPPKPPKPEKQEQAKQEKNEQKARV